MKGGTRRYTGGVEERADVGDRVEAPPTLTLVTLSVFSHCSLSFSASLVLNRSSLTCWYHP